MLDSYAGTYYVEEYGLTIVVHAEEDHLSISTPRGSRYTFYPWSDSRFFSIEDKSELDIVRRREEPDELRLWGMVGQRRSIA